MDVNNNLNALLTQHCGLAITSAVIFPAAVRRLLTILLSGLFAGTCMLMHLMAHGSVADLPCGMVDADIWTVLQGTAQGGPPRDRPRKAYNMSCHSGETSNFQAGI